MLTEHHVFWHKCCPLSLLAPECCEPHTRAHTKDRQTAAAVAAVDKMVPFKTKIWFMHSLAVVHTLGPSRVGCSQLDRTVVLSATNGAFIKLEKPLSRGSQLHEGNNCLLTFSEGGYGQKRLWGRSYVQKKHQNTREPPPILPLSYLCTLPVLSSKATCKRTCAWKAPGQ